MKRVCSGKLLADSFIWLAVATSLATVHIDRALDDAGNEITPVYAVTEDAIRFVIWA